MVTGLHKFQRPNLHLNAGSPDILSYGVGLYFTFNVFNAHLTRFEYGLPFKETNSNEAASAEVESLVVMMDDDKIQNDMI